MVMICYSLVFGRSACSIYYSTCVFRCFPLFPFLTPFCFPPPPSFSLPLLSCLPPTSFFLSCPSPSFSLLSYPPLSLLLSHFFLVLQSHLYSPTSCPSPPFLSFLVLLPPFFFFLIPPPFLFNFFLESEWTKRLRERK